jgi:hypothetical protein
VDTQILDMLRDRFDSLDSKMEDLNVTMANHVEKDERYWLKIEAAEGQINLIRWLGGSLSISGLAAWLFSHFGKQ